MAYNIVVPELSESVVEATVAEWLKGEGDSVEAGEVVVVLETDKVSLEVTADEDGTLSQISAGEGEDVTAGDVLGVVDSDGTASSSSPASSEGQDKAAQPEPQAVNAQADNQRATPVAQRVAAEHNVDLSQVQPTGDRIKREDVERHINGGAQTQPASKPAAQAQPPKKSAPKPAPANGARPEERQRLSRRRQTIARRLVEAQSTAAMLTTFNEIDMTAIIDMRTRRKEAFKEKHGVSLGFSAFFVKAVIGALKSFPAINAEMQDNEIVFKKYYDIGIAIGAEEGLVVPVVRDADRLSFAEIESQIREYAIQSREGRLAIESLMGGTFTITNGGVFGSMMSTPILNPPQVGILGLHAITERPVAIDGEVVIRPMMYVALTYDHRIVDGREAVQFLVRVKALIEDPETLLIEG